MTYSQYRPVNDGLGIVAVEYTPPAAHGARCTSRKLVDRRRLLHCIRPAQHTGYCFASFRHWTGRQRRPGAMRREVGYRLALLSWWLLVSQLIVNIST